MVTSQAALYIFRNSLNVHNLNNLVKLLIVSFDNLRVFKKLGQEFYHEAVLLLFNIIIRKKFVGASYHKLTLFGGSLVDCKDWLGDGVATFAGGEDDRGGLLDCQGASEGVDHLKAPHLLLVILTLALYLQNVQKAFGRHSVVYVNLLGVVVPINVLLDDRILVERNIKLF